MSYVSMDAHTDSHIIPNPAGTTVHAHATTDPNKARKEQAKEKGRQLQAEGKDLWAHTKDRVFQPYVAGGLFSIVNLGVLGGLGYLLYTEPSYRRDYKVIGGSVAGIFLLFGAEGALTESYLQTPEGQREKERVEAEGSALYRQTREIVLRPGVFGGILGVVNVGILGSLGYLAYKHWDEPSWDRSYVTGITAGTAALFTAQGYLAEQYREKEYPKRK
ncbi:hypothetical protein FRC17_004972 [Serendipita sp. 399]|nr:hypothetical protein FRC17_004974 [Serendipita sp. 399]KAG8806477.1 hypothetical protein FRC17_004972 [Serendipita sp. 399]